MSRVTSGVEFGRRAAVLPAGSRRAAAALRVLAGQAGTGVEMVLGLRNATNCANPQHLILPRRSGDLDHDLANNSVCGLEFTSTYQPCPSGPPQG
jgi:hypothetical protein